MARIELKGVSHSYELGECAELPADYDIANKCVINALDISWEDGTASALLGPSGCGKTTLLNIISGLLKPTVGKIEIGGRDATMLSPRDRHIAQIFQFPVVYDTMTVYANLSFPLENAGVSKEKIDRRVRDIAEILELSHLLKESAGRVSQAEKQKVSLGRGIVREDTVAILLDEPLTVIDPKEKYILRRKLREVQRALRITMIYVTHDQHEALTFADHVTVLKDGRVVQSGTPEELHADPQSPFIGYFIGSPGMNLLRCTMRGEELDFGEFRHVVGGRLKEAVSKAKREVTYGIRPEFVEASAAERSGWPSLQVEVVEHMGSYKILTLRSNGMRIKSRVSAGMNVREGNRVWINFPEDKAKIFVDDARVY
jgi:glycerol transport system ATP-binding protein